VIDALDQAIYDTIHGFAAPGGERGATALAARVGMNAGTLNNKAYPGHDSQLTLRESVPVQRETRCYQILHTYAALLDLFCDYHAEVGEVSGSVRDCLADGRVTREELRVVQQRFIRAAKAGMEFLSRLEAIAEDDDGE